MWTGDGAAAFDFFKVDNENTNHAENSNPRQYRSYDDPFGIIALVLIKREDYNE